MAQDAERTAVPGIVTDRAAPLTAAETAGPPGAAAAAARRWWVLGVVGLAQLMVVLDATIVNIALPSAQHDLGERPQMGAAAAGPGDAGRSRCARGP